VRIDARLEWMAVAASAGCPVMAACRAWNDAQRDRVVRKKTMTGTHTGEFDGISPTGKRVDIQYVDILRLRDGQIIEHWLSMDQLSFMRQLGGDLAVAHRSAR
jgi:ketosteroid isomerase-like protein